MENRKEYNNYLIRIGRKIMQRLAQQTCHIIGIMLCALIANNAIANTLFVSNVGSNSVTLFDVSTLERLKDISVGYKPHEIAVTPNNKFALVANYGTTRERISGDAVTLINVENTNVVQTIKLQENSRPHGIVFISDTQALVTAQGIQSLLLIDIAKGEVIKTISLPGSTAHIITIDKEQAYAYLSNIDSGDVYKMNLKTFTVDKKVNIGREAQGSTLTNDGNLLLVTDLKDNYVAVMRTKDLSLLKKVKTDFGPVRVALFNNGNSAVVANSISGTAQVIDIATLEITRSFSTTPSGSVLTVPNNILINDDQSTAYITNEFAGKIVLIDLKNGEILKTFKAGRMPNGLAMSRAIHHL